MAVYSRVIPLLMAALASAALAADAPDLILHNGQIATVDKQFRVVEALAVRGDRIQAVGSSAEILKLKGDKTQLIDLAGGFVMPGLIDSHVHATSAALHEYDHPVPDMETIADVLAYIRSRAAALPEGDWISVRQIFITRLKEQRYPSKAELDAAAPKHPVVFSTGPDAMCNTLALKESGIDKDFQITGAGLIEKDPKTGELTGLLRNCGRYIKSKASGKTATEEEKQARLQTLFADYNSVGLTAVADRNAADADIARFHALKTAGKLTVRMRCSASLDATQPLEAIRERLAGLAKHALRQPDNMLQIVGVKSFQDGGMLTGSAYMRQPWGLSDIYLITDPNYRGVLFIEPEKLREIVHATVKEGLQYTAHSVGDAAVHNLLDAYEEAAKTLDVRKTRPCVTHCNFMSLEAVEKLARLGAVADIQPAWLYLDARTLHKQFGEDRLRYFQPLKTLFEKGGIAGGGSDHMQKVGSLRSINPYNPFLGLATTLTRRARWFDGQLHPEEALSREQALRFYTSNNAHIIFLDDAGSLEPGKLADFILLDRNLLTCPLDDVQDTQVLKTYLGGKAIYQRK